MIEIMQTFACDLISDKSSERSGHAADAPHERLRLRGVRRELVEKRPRLTRVSALFATTVHLCVYPVERGKCCSVSVWLHKSASMRNDNIENMA